MRMLRSIKRAFARIRAFFSSYQRVYLDNCLIQTLDSFLVTEVPVFSKNGEPHGAPMHSIEINLYEPIDPDTAPEVDFVERTMRAQNSIITILTRKHFNRISMKSYEGWFESTSPNHACFIGKELR